MKINVLKRHIEEGKAQSCTKCPIALAVLDMFKRGTVFINPTTFVLYPEFSEKYQIYVLPVEAQRFIAAFDAGAEVEPFSFEVI